jgi:hypothetical protein
MAATAKAATLEYAVKAAYLYKFAPFVEWPASAFASPTSPFNLCVLGEDPFGAALDQAVDGRRVGEHPAVVRRMKRVDAGSGCHILYLGASRAQTTAEALRSVQGAPVLTVADRGPASSGSIIQFVVRDNRVRFDIDAAAAAANRVAISSKLLSLSVSASPGA